MTPAERDALRTYAMTLPAGAVVSVPREHLLVLLGNDNETSKEESPALLTVEEVAARLRVDGQTVRRRQKQLGFVRIGRAVRFPEDGLTKYLERGRRAAQAT